MHQHRPVEGPTLEVDVQHVHRAGRRAPRTPQRQHPRTGCQSLPGPSRWSAPEVDELVTPRIDRRVPRHQGTAERKTTKKRTGSRPKEEFGKRRAAVCASAPVLAALRAPERRAGETPLRCLRPAPNTRSGAPAAFSCARLGLAWGRHCWDALARRAEDRQPELLEVEAVGVVLPRNEKTRRVDAVTNKLIRNGHDRPHSADRGWHRGRSCPSLCPSTATTSVATRDMRWTTAPTGAR